MTTFGTPARRARLPAHWTMTWLEKMTSTRPTNTISRRNAADQIAVRSIFDRVQHCVLTEVIGEELNRVDSIARSSAAVKDQAIGVENARRDTVLGHGTSSDDLGLTRIGMAA